MEDEEPRPTAEDDDQQNRMAMGIALGTPLGVVLSLLLDNWGMLGVGIALGAAFGAIPSARRRAVSDGHRPEEDT
jgi:hypothetical protein